jgi:hypothetical protein
VSVIFPPDFQANQRVDPQSILPESWPRQSFQRVDPSRSYQRVDLSQSYQRAGPGRSCQRVDPGQSYQRVDPGQLYQRVDPRPPPPQSVKPENYPRWVIQQSYTRELTPPPSGRSNRRIILGWSFKRVAPAGQTRKSENRPGLVNKILSSAKNFSGPYPRLFCLRATNPLTYWHGENKRRPT